MPVGELDWMICNGGADIWQLLPEHDGKESTWVADEQWEGHISFRHVHPYPFEAGRRAIPYGVKNSIQSRKMCYRGMNAVARDKPKGYLFLHQGTVAASETPCTWT